MPDTVKLKDIKPGMERLNIVAEVSSLGEPIVRQTRYGEAKTAVAVIEDETGKANLKLWREQLDIVHVGDKIRVENGFATEFGGKTEVSVGSRGHITVVGKKQQ